MSEHESELMQEHLDELEAAAETAVGISVDAPLEE